MNNILEHIKTLHEYAHIFENHSDIVTAFRVAQDILARELPKKPVKVNHVYICANDGVFLLYDDEIPNENDSYCSRCGQKIDWSDVNGDKV